MKLKKIYNQPSWVLRTKQVSAAVTQTGGHLAPVYFNRDRRAIQPYHIAPWWNEKVPADLPPLLKALRGDFFCAPFGHNVGPFRGEQHPLHGEVANRPWQFVDCQKTGQGTCLHLKMNVKVRPGRVDKRVALVAGHNVVYQQHVLAGMSGPMCVGHHPNLQFPAAEASGKIAVSPFLFGRSSPYPVDEPAKGGYPFLKNDVEFHDLQRVPTIWGTTANLSEYPNFRGFCDLALMINDPKLKYGWSSVTFRRESYVWFTLKDPRVLKATLMWRSNGGTWSGILRGRHFGCLGIEDVAWYFGENMTESLKPSPMTRAGIEPFVKLNPKRPTVINYIQGCVPVPKGFAEVKNIEVVSDDALVIHGQAGQRVRVPCATSFVHTGQLAGLI